MLDTDQRFAQLSEHDLQQITYALLREWASDVAVSRRGAFVDFRVISLSALGIQHSQRFRLFLHTVTTADLARLRQEAAAVGLTPVGIAPLGLAPGTEIPAGMQVIDAEAFDQLCEQSGVLVRDNEGRLSVDSTALSELSDQENPSFTFVNGLLWLRALSRNRCPPGLRWTGTPPHELFERCFFLTMTTTFRARGMSWGAKKRGRAVPDGVLELSGTGDAPTLYDCKAAYAGYSMSHRDLTGFVDYLRHPIAGAWSCPHGVVPRFLVVSSEIHGGRGNASYRRRQRALDQRVPGAKLTWIRAPDLVRFGLALEQAEVTPTHRDSIRWATLLDAGDVRWPAFESALHRLAEVGYRFAEAL